MEENIIKVVHCKTKDIFNQRFAEINVSPEEKDENPYYYYVIVIQDTGEVYTHGKIINSDTLNKLKTLIGNDSDKSARKIAEEEVSKVIDNAPEMYDTLQEIAAWIEEHGDEVTEINNGITTNAQNISTISKHIAWNATDIIPNYKYYITKSEFIAEHPDYQNENSIVYNDIVYIHDVKEIYTHGRFYNEYATFDYTEFEGDGDVYVSEYVRQTSTIASIINNYGIIPVQIKNKESFLGIGVATIYIDTKSTVKSILCKTIWLDNWTDSENQKHVIFKAEYNEDGEVRYELIQKDYVFANHKTSHLIAQELTVNDQKLQLDGSIDTYVKGNGTLGKINEFLASDGVAKFANDLTGRNEATAEEFTLRPSAGNKSIRDDSATIKRIKGNSVVWNQQLKTLFSPNITADTITTNGITFTRLSSGGYTISGSNNTSDSAMSNNTVANLELKAGHKYIIIPIGLRKSTISFYGPESGVNSFVTADMRIITPTNSASVYLRSVVQAGVIDVNETIYCNVHDLTQMFGAGNEPTTVEEFRALYPDSYYPYNPGELRNLDCSGIKTVGFNQWDEQWESGAYSYWTNGTKSDHPEYIRSTNFIKVIPANTYCLNIAAGVDAQVGFYDENNNFLGQASFSYSNNSRLFQVPANCQKITFYTKATTYNNDICINLSHTGVENGKYEPYWDATKDLSIIQKYFPNGMRSAGSIYDEISFDETTQKWVAIQRVGNVDLGTLTWTYSNNEFVSLSIESLMTYPATKEDVGNILCSKYSSHPYTGSSLLDKAIFTSWQTAQLKAIWIKDSAYSDAASFKTAMSGVLLNYELAEPIITVIEEPINLSYKVGDFGIEQILSDSFSAPFRADIIYQFNATDRIRENSLNIEKLSKTQKDYLPLAGGTMSGQINSQDIKPVEDNTYQLGDSTHKYKNVFSDFFTGNLEGNAKTATVATDLSGRVEDTPEVFTYRPSAGEKSIKDDNAFIRRVKGNSVAFNQMISTPPVMPYTNRCNLSISGNDINATVNSIEYDYVGFYYSLPDNRHPKTVNGHTYFISGLFSCPKQATIAFGVGSSSIKQLVPANTLYSYNTIQKQTSDAVGAIFTCWIEDIQVDDTFKVQNWNVIDLTQMFGAGNEPTTVEEFRALYPNSYYPYNPGELRNLDCNGIKTVGFNLVDKNNFLTGAISSSDTPIQLSDFRYIKVPVFPNTKYYLKDVSNMYHYYSYVLYDSNMNRIIASGKVVAGDKPYNISIVITTPSNAAYMIVNVHKDFVDTCCVNLHHTGWRDGEYEPYKEVTHSLPLSQITNGEPLRKAGSVYDEINETEYIKRVGVVDLGSLVWINATNNIFACTEMPNMIVTTDVALRLDGLLCTKYAIDTTPSIDATMSDKTMKRKNGWLYIKDTSFTDVASFKASLSGVLLHYELAEPIVTPIETPIDFNYYVEDFGTEEALLAEDSAPFSADIVYQFNATDQIRNNSRNIDKLQKSAFTPRGTSAQYIRGDGSYGNVLEFTQAIPINDGEYEMPDAIQQFILTPNYYAKSPVELDNTTTVTVYVTPPEDSNYLAEYWFEFKTGEVLPDITFTSSTEDTKFRIAGDMLGDAVNILHLISSDGGMTFFGEMKHYIL